MISMCVSIVFSTSGIIFNPSTSVIIDHSQSVKDITLFQVSAPCGGPRPPKAGTHFTEWVAGKSVLILPNEWSKPGEQAHVRNKFLLWMGFELTTS